MAPDVAVLAVVDDIDRVVMLRQVDGEGVAVGILHEQAGGIVLNVVVRDGDELVVAEQERGIVCVVIDDLVVRPSMSSRFSRKA